MKGGIVIFAAGNDGISGPGVPGAYEKVVAVASLVDGRRSPGPTTVRGSISRLWAAMALPATNDFAFSAPRRTAVTVTSAGTLDGRATGFGHCGLGCRRIRCAKTGVHQREIAGNTRGFGPTETINPEYAGMLGNGLVDAEYVLFYDTRPDPVDERTIAVSGYRTHAEHVVACSAMLSGASSSSFDVYIDTRTFSAAMYGHSPATAVRHTFASDASLSVKLLPAESRGWNRGKVIAWQSSPKSVGRSTSRPAVISVRTGENTRPRQPLPFRTSFCKVTTKRAGASIFNFIFADADASGRSAFSYFRFAFRGKGRGVPRTGFGAARTALRRGLHDTDRNGKDLDGAAATSEFQVIVDGTGVAMELFPQSMPRCTQRTHSGRRGRFFHSVPQCGGAAGARYAGFDPRQRQR